VHYTELEVLRTVSRILEPQRRNRWAQGLFDTLIEDQAPYSFRKWLHGKSVDPVNKLIVVVDEAGHNLDFARGVIESHRLYIPTKFRTSRTKMLATQCTLVLSGSGLDSIEDEYDSIGTDPSKYIPVRLKPPNVKRFAEEYCNDELDRVEVEAILEEGTISSIMKTNTRLLMNGLKRILDIKELQWKDEDYKSLLVMLFSSPEAMSLPVKWFMDLN